jgi:hypothetical protein
MNALSKIKNYFFDVKVNIPEKIRVQDPQHLSRFISPVQLARTRQDILTWRDAIKEAEQAYFPHRVKEQRMFQDTVLNGHVSACMQKRKNLTLLKDFYITDETGEVDDLVLGKIFKKKWFYDVMNYALDANYFGYSLINLGNVVKDEFEQVELVRRHNISPDRLQVTSYVYSLFGVNFTDPEFVDWALWVPTNNEIGVGKCGHGCSYRYVN